MYLVFCRFELEDTCSAHVNKPFLPKVELWDSAVCGPQPNVSAARMPDEKRFLEMRRIEVDRHTPNPSVV